MTDRRVLYLDLTNEKAEVEDKSDLFEKYLGGTGVAVELLKVESDPTLDPLSPEAAVVFAIGPLTLHFPCCSKVVCVFKSPLTGNFGETHAGGRLAYAMRLAGYDAIVVKGCAHRPTYVTIHGENVSFKDATTLWGVSVHSTGKVLREIEPGAGQRSIIRIGPAGERKIRFANVNVDIYRHFGRLGLGAVFGSKKLKAMVISGSRSYPLRKAKEYEKVYKAIYDEVTRSDAMKKYHDIGTAQNILNLNERGAFPTRNFSQSKFEEAESISGERLAETLLVRKTACSGCPVGCIHVANLRIQFAEGYEYGTLHVPYDYEPLYALGSMLEIRSPDAILMLIEKSERYGMDTISLGVILAWMTEAFEKGIITDEETAGQRPVWGDATAYAKIVDLMIEMPNEFYKSLGRGLEAAAHRYGGLEFAMVLGGNEVAGYHCGPATVVGQLLGARHSHLDNAGYSVDLKGVADDEEIVNALLEEEQWRNVLTSLVVCLFAREVYREGVVSDALSSVGVERSVDDLRRLGIEIYKGKWKLKISQGFNFDNLRIPRRFFETPTSSGLLGEDFIKKLIQLYRSRIQSIISSSR